MRRNEANGTPRTEPLWLYAEAHARASWSHAAFAQQLGGGNPEAAESRGCGLGVRRLGRGKPGTLFAHAKGSNKLRPGGTHRSALWHSTLQLADASTSRYAGINTCISTVGKQILDMQDNGADAVRVGLLVPGVVLDSRAPEGTRHTASLAALPPRLGFCARVC